MKNLKYFPFERNRYFYGKFLSVDDFEAEQRYMNDKRRVLNRFLYGVGVVCGMQVVEVDDFTISLEAGLALDFSGREIVVAAPVVKRLSAIEGFSKYSASGEDRQELYLCITYDEHMEEPVHNVTKAGEEQEAEFNKYAESYRLFVTGESPESEGEQITAAYEEIKTVYEGNGIRIRQKVPKYIESDTDAEIEIFIDKIQPVKTIRFTYQMKLTCLEQEGRDLMTVSFNESDFTSAKSYKITGCVHAKSVVDTAAFLEIIPDSFTLMIGEDSQKARMQGSFAVRITSVGLSETVLKNYYNSAMEDILRNPYGHAIYLARLKVIKAGDTYVIEEVENLPFGQYVWNNTLSAALETIRLRQMPAADKHYTVNPVVRTMPDTRALEQEMQIKAGSAVVDLGIGGISGQKFYTEEIVHGLGLGEVFIFLGLSKGVQESRQIICGSQGIFDDKICPRIEMAAKVNMTRGSFVIGIKCLEQVEAKRLRVYWMAVKNKSALGEQEKEKHLSIRPDILNMKVRENHYFEAVMENEVKKHVSWSVKEENGGTIDANGHYTAPNQPGVYEIVAQSMEDEQIKAAVYVIVREDKWGNRVEDMRT